MYDDKEVHQGLRLRAEHVNGMCHEAPHDPPFRK
jgi:hypothetical protein